MIYVRFENDFLLKKMISNEHKMITAEMISSRCCCKNSRLDLLLRKKTFPTEIIISGNGWKSFFSRKCLTTSENRKCVQKKTEVTFLRKWFPMQETLEMISNSLFPFRNDFLVKILVLFVNDFHFEMIFLETISIWKWFLLNDLLPQKIIFCCFLLKKNDLQL